MGNQGTQLQGPHLTVLSGESQISAREREYIHGKNLFFVVPDGATANDVELIHGALENHRLRLDINHLIRRGIEDTATGQRDLDELKKEVLIPKGVNPGFCDSILMSCVRQRRRERERHYANEA